MSRHREDGVASVLAVAMCGVLVTFAVAVMSAVALVATHRVAQAAADLASLAGAGALPRGDDPCLTAEQVARRNHAHLLRCQVSGWDVAVVVEATTRLPLGRVQLPARARSGPGRAQDDGS